MSNDCVFCQKVADSSVIPVTSNVVRFEPLNPVVPGHMLFIDKQHTTNAATNPRITGRVAKAAAEYAAGMKQACNIIINNGGDAGQTIFHLHVHVVPRRIGDGLKMPWSDQVKGGKGGREDE